MSQEVLEIVNGISQVLSKKYDGALNEDGTPVEIGLRREKYNDMFKKRLVDGFNAYVQGNRLVIKYQAEISLREVHNKNFESEVSETINNIIKWIKSEYKKTTKKSLGLKEADKEPDILVQNTSRVRTWIQANQSFVLTELEEPQENPKTAEEKLSQSIKDWIELGK